MKDFDHLKKKTRFNIIFSSTVNLILIVIFILLGVKVNANYFYLVLIDIFMLFPLTFLLLSKGILELRTKVFEKTFSLVNDLGFTYQLNEAIDGIEIKKLGIDRRSKYFKISSIIRGDYENLSYYSYHISFKEKLKRVSGKVILIKGDFIKKDIKHPYLEKGNYEQIIKSSDNQILIFVGQVNNEAYSYDPFEYKTYKHYYDNMKLEFDFYKYLVVHKK